MTWRGVQGRKKKLEKLYEESHRHYGGAYKDDDGRITDIETKGYALYKIG